VENLRVVRVRRRSVFCSVSNEVFGVRESHIRGGCPVAVVVGDNLDLAVLPDTDATAWDDLSVH